jgi:hypothetical protein
MSDMVGVVLMRKRRMLTGGCRWVVVERRVGEGDVDEEVEWTRGRECRRARMASLGNACGRVFTFWARRQTIPE